MQIDHRAELSKIKRFDQLIAYLRDEMGWPIAQDSFEDVDDLFYDFTPDELGIDVKNAAKIQEIKRLRPLSPKQPWGIFFVKFEPKRLPVVALRRILGQVALKKRASANSAEMAAWAADDLLFVSNYGEGEERQISFAHFSKAQDGHDLPTLKVLGWDNLDTALHLDAVVRELTEHLAWPDDDTDVEAWRERWRTAFTLRHREVITTSKELSIRLAELARAIRDRTKSALAIEISTGPLNKLMKAFQEALVHDLDADSFADMYAQTIAYGLLSARITNPERRTADDFVDHMRTNPFLRDLMQTFLKVGGRRDKSDGPGIDFDELGVSEVVELLDNANMEAVVRDFGDKNPQEDPVIHFYELFLKEYDARKRMQRGVFYTPRPVVSYIVRSVDELLRTEFGLEDGLADTTTWGEMVKRKPSMKIPEGVSPDEPFVQILDPATGTATFLVEVIDLIYKTMRAKWINQGHLALEVQNLWNEYVPKHLLPRLYGFELMMAPYAIAHLKIGLKLLETHYRFESNKRVGIYLTNSLEPASDIGQQTLSGMFPALAHEAQAVNEVKRNQRFSVVIGNPPYSILSANMSPSQRSIVERYRFVDGYRIRERGALQFEKNIQDDYVKFYALAEDVLSRSGAAILGYVSNANYLDAGTLRGLRASLCANFPVRLIIDLHGDGTGILLDDAHGEDKNVFDILQGVAIGIFARYPNSNPRTERTDLGGSRESKFNFLSSNSFQRHMSINIFPTFPLYDFSTKDLKMEALWDKWPSIISLFRQYSAGIITARDHVVICEDRSDLIRRIEGIRDSALLDNQLMSEYQIPKKRGWDFARARKSLCSLKNVENETQLLAYRPFDNRSIFYHQSLVWGRAWPTMQHLLDRNNLALAVCKQLHKRTDSWQHIFVCRGLGESSFVSNKSKEVTSFFPVLLSNAEQSSLFGGVTPNIAWPGKVIENPNVSATSEPEMIPETMAGYIYAILHSPRFRTIFRDFLARGFPRIPLASSADLKRDLIGLGDELIALHLMESPKLDKSITEFIKSHNPIVENISWEANTVWVDEAQTTGFKGVHKGIWNFYIGSYQVCKKWLKDRKGRALFAEDIAHYQKIVVAVNETIRVMKEIDEVIEKYGGWPGAFAQAQQTIGPNEKVSGDTIKTKAIQTEGKSNKQEEAQVEIVLSKEKETPGTWRFKEDKEDHPMTIYLTKEQVKELGDPQSIKVTIEAA